MIDKKALILLGVSMFFVSCLPGDAFQKLPSEFDKENFFRKKNTPIDAFLNQGFKMEKVGNHINIYDSTSSQDFKNVVFISYVDENYIGLITGLPTLDAGWRYLILPTYSELVFLDKENLSIVFRKKVNHSVSDLVLKDSLVFFEYGTYPKLKYGKFPFSE